MASGAEALKCSSLPTATAPSRRKGVSNSRCRGCDWASTRALVILHEIRAKDHYKVGNHLGTTWATTLPLAK